MAKIVINIPDETYEYIKRNYKYGIGAKVACDLGFAVAKGNIVPKISKDTIESITQLAQDYENWSFCLAHEEALELYKLLEVTHNNE